MFWLHSVHLSSCLGKIPPLCLSTLNTLLPLALYSAWRGAKPPAPGLVLDMAEAALALKNTFVCLDILYDNLLI